MVAGEASADLHGANLVKAVHKLAPSVSFKGVGGSRMAEAGVEILVPASEMAVVGLFEVLPRLARIRNVAQRLKRMLKRCPPDLLLLMDYPEFNLYLARHAKRLGIPVLYYISPQVWAWRRGRIKKIARRVDRMAVILPFEEGLYRRTGMPVTYVGHPLMDEVSDFGGRKEARRLLGLDGRWPVLGLLPGSRNEEIDNLLPPMLGAAKILKQCYPGLLCVLPVAPTLSAGRVERMVEDAGIHVILWHRNMHRILPGCDLAMVASGTATLETAIHKIPMVITYRVSPASYHIGKAVIRVPFIGLVNLVAGEEVVPEIIQDEVTTQRLAREAARILEDGTHRAGMLKGLEKVKRRLGAGGASQRTAEIVLAMLG